MNKIFIENAVMILDHLSAELIYMIIINLNIYNISFNTIRRIFYTLKLIINITYIFFDYYNILF